MCGPEASEELGTLQQGFMHDNIVPDIPVLMDKWMLTVKPVYKLKNVSDDLKWTTYCRKPSCGFFFFLLIVNFFV